MTADKLVALAERLEEIRLAHWPIAGLQEAIAALRALAQSAASGSPPYVELLKSPDGKLYWQTSIPPLTMPLGRYQLVAKP